jgi:hypothetical protein
MSGEKLKFWGTLIGGIAGLCAIVIFGNNYLSMDRKIDILKNQNKELQITLSDYQSKIEYYKKLIITAIKLRRLIIHEIKQAMGDDFINIEKKLEISEVMAKAAWASFNDGDYHGAIIISSDCISTIGPDAFNEQDRLGRRGEIFSENEIEAISKSDQKETIKRRLINNAGTCWFIKGRSFERLRKIREAIDAYSEAEFYTLARTMQEPSGLFLVPARIARARRRYLEEIYR